MSAAPNPFSAGNPALRIAWDSSALAEYQFCPRSYSYKYVEGWRPKVEAIDLSFGKFAASAFERYHKARLDGLSKREAMRAVLQWLIHATRNWPDGGENETMWRCTGVTPYKNLKGNKALCPFSHKGKLFPMPTPGDKCGECGSPLEIGRHFIAPHHDKNRVNLIRMVVWYIDDQPEIMEDGLHPIKLADGTPAVELGGRLPLPIKTPYGETYLLTWYFDYLAAFGSEHFIVDHKTTKKGLTTSYWSQYSPNLQFDTYDMVGDIVLPEYELAGVLVDAAQILVGGARFARHAFYHTEEQRAEHFVDLTEWIKDAERSAEAGYWRMNKRNCSRCAFRAVCSASPEDRAGILRDHFVKGSPWNPLEER